MSEIIIPSVSLGIIIGIFIDYFLFRLWHSGFKRRIIELEYYYEKIKQVLKKLKEEKKKE